MATDVTTQSATQPVAAGLPTANELFNQIYALKRQRELFEPGFYLSRKAYDGKHFVYWNKELQKISDLPVKRPLLNQLPELAHQTDSYENFILTTDFAFNLIPKRLSNDKALDDSYFLSLLAKDYYEKLRSSTIYSDFAHNALLDNASYIEVTPNDQVTNVEWNTFDAFDILHDLTIKDWKKKPLIVKIVKKREPDIRSSKLYSIPADYKIPVGQGQFSSWKDLYEKERYGTPFMSLKKDESLLFECQMPSADGLRIVTLDMKKTVLRDSSYPSIKNRTTIVPLRIFSGEWYQTSYVGRLIPINRSIDILASRFEDLALRLAKGGILVQEDEDIQGALNEEMGQIIKFAAIKPEQLQMPVVPQFMMEWFQNYLTLAERYGVPSMLSGNLPQKSSGIRASAMIDQIKSLVVQNNSAVINSYRNAVKEILELIFLYLYEMWDTPQDVVQEDLGKDIPSFISAKYKALTPDQNTVGIPPDFSKFEVEVDNGLGYTLEQRKITTLELYREGLIGKLTAQKMFKLGSSAYMMEAEIPPMYQSPEFQMMLQQFPNMAPDQKDAFIKVLQMLGSGQGGGTPATPTTPGAAPPGTNPGNMLGLPPDINPGNTFTGRQSGMPPEIAPPRGPAPVPIPQIPRVGPGPATGPAPGPGGF